MTQFGTPLSPSLATAQAPETGWVGGPAYVSTPTTRTSNRRARQKSVADRAAAAVRQANARECLMILRDAEEPLTVADLATRTGLSRPTVDAVLQDLIAAGPVRTTEPSESSTPGRPARRFVANPSTTLVAGVDVGADAIRCTVTDAAGRTVARTQRRLDPTAPRDHFDAVTDAVEDVVATATERVRSDHDRPYPTDDILDLRLAAVGLAVPGIFDHDHRLTHSVTFPEWTGTDLGAELSQRLGCPVVVENDLKLAAYAEHHIGETAANMIFVQLGRRISVALMVGGRILQGSHRMAGELGAQRGMRWTASYDHAGLHWSTGREARPLFDRAAVGDPQAIAEVDEFCEQIAPRLATLVLTIDPELVIIGGGLSLAGDVLLEPLRRHLDQLLPAPARPEVAAARLTDGPVTGALGHAFDQASEQIFGIPDVPPPWCRLRAATQTDPRPPVR